MFGGEGRHSAPTNKSVGNSNTKLFGMQKVKKILASKYKLTRYILRQKFHRYYRRLPSTVSNTILISFLMIYVLGASWYGINYFLHSQAASAATTDCTWTNGGANNIWNNSANWSCGNVPNNTNNVIFNGATSTANITIDVAATAGSFTVYGTNLPTPSNVAYTGTITANFGLTTDISSAGTGDFYLGGGTYTANATNISVAGNWTNAGTFTCGTATVTFNGTATGHTINPGASSFYNLIFNGAGGAWSPLTNTVTVTKDLTMTAGTFDTSNGTANVTVNGNVAGTAGIINMTSTNTFNQRTGSSKNFATTSGSANWTFYNLKFENSNPGYPNTITLASGGSGQIITSGTLTVGNASDYGTTIIDDETNDRIIDANGDVMVTSKGVLSTSSTASFTIAGNYANSGTFTANSGTVTFDKSSSTQTLNSGGTASVNTFNNLTHSGAGTLQLITSNINIDGTFTNSAGTFQANGLNMSVTGSWSNTATFTAGAGAVTFDATAIGKTIVAGSSYFNNVTFNGSGGGWTIQTNNFNAGGTIDITSGTVNTGTKTFGAPGTTDMTVNGGTLTGGSGYIGTRNLTVSSGAYTAGSGGAQIAGGIYTHSGGTVDWTTNDATALFFDYDASLPADTYHNLDFEISFGTFTKTATVAGSFTAEGYLHLTEAQESYILFAIGANTVTVYGDVTIDNASTYKSEISMTSGTLKVGGNYVNTGTLTPGTGTVEFDKASSTQTLNSGGTTTGFIFNNLTHSGAGTLQLITNNINIDGNFTNSGGTFDANGLNMNVAKDWNIAGGAFSAGGTPGAQTVTFDSTNNSTISGSATFNNLTMDSAVDGAKQINFTAGATQTINGTWTLDGDVGKVLTLRSTTPISAWKFVIPANFTAGDYVDVQDSQNTTNAYLITPGANTTNSGNNIPGWLFIVTAPTIGTPSAQSATSIRWNFTDTADNETGFKVYNAADTLVAVCATTNLTYCDETGLSVNTEYTGRYVVAYNDAGNSAHSAAASAIYTLANTPAALTVAGGYNETDGYFADLTLNANGNPDGTEYQINTDSWAAQDNGAVLKQTALTCNQNYTFQVRARNGDLVTTASSAGEVDMTPLCAPVNLTETNLTATSAVLSWDIAAGTNLVYDISFGTDAAAANLGVASNVTDLTLAEGALDPATTYYYKVRVHNLDGTTGAWSAIKSFLTHTTANRLLIVLPGQTYIVGTGVIGTPDHQVAGVSFSARVIAVDSNNNVTPDYNHLVTFAAPTDDLISAYGSNDGRPAEAVVSVAGINDVSFTFYQAKSQIISASGSSGSSANFIVDPAPVSQVESMVTPLTQTLPVTQMATITVKLIDSFGNNISGHNLTVSSDQSGDTVSVAEVTGLDGTAAITVSSGSAHTTTLTITDKTADLILNAEPQIIFTESGDSSSADGLSIMASIGKILDDLVPQKVQEAVSVFLDNNSQTVNTSFVATSTAIVLAPPIVNAVIGLGNLIPQTIYWIPQLLTMIGIRKRRKPWGVIFDSQTGTPLISATVRIFDKEYHRLLESSITDNKGRFGFLVNPGTFYLTASKSGFKFPSQFKISEFYENIYSGGNIDIDPKTDKTIIFNIPLDPATKVSIIFKLTVMMVLLNRFLQKIRLPVMIIGVIFATIMIVTAYNIIYVLSLMLYGLFLVLEIIRTKKSRSYGVVSDVSGKPLEITIVRIFNKKTNRFIATAVTDGQGRFIFFVDPGLYYIAASKLGYVDFKSETMSLEGEKTMVTVNIKLKKIEQ